MGLPMRARVRARPLGLALALVLACNGGAVDSSISSGAASTSIAPPTISSTTTLTGGTSTTAEATTTTAPVDPPTFDSLEGIDTIRDFAGYTDSGMSRWQESVPGIEDIRLTASADGAEQPAFWLAPQGEGDRPLLVILHSWSSDYLQHAGIPYAMWAQENGWAAIAPQFRGINDDPDAIGSELAVQDVVDAIDYATSQDGVDADRVYAVGYSGGGMMSLLLAGRHPDKVTAVAAWGPPYDLIAFYRQSVGNGRHYAGEIRAGCGGDPSDEDPAQEECLRRSPMTYLDGAREAEVPILIGQGIHDPLLSPSQGARAFNQLAVPDERLSDEEVEAIGQGGIPEDLAGPIDIETYFGEGDPAPVFARHSGAALLVFFDKDHDMVYKASLRWFTSDQR